MEQEYYTEIMELRKKCEDFYNHCINWFNTKKLEEYDNISCVINFVMIFFKENNFSDQDFVFLLDQLKKVYPFLLHDDKPKTE